MDRKWHRDFEPSKRCKDRMTIWIDVYQSHGEGGNEFPSYDVGDYDETKWTEWDDI